MLKNRLIPVVFILVTGFLWGPGASKAKLSRTRSFEIESSISSIRSKAQIGDVIFIGKTGVFWNDLARRFSRKDQGFGHVGIITTIAKTGAVTVVHAGGDPERGGRVMSVQLKQFLKGTSRIAHKRPYISDGQRLQAVRYARAAARKGIAFDADFSLEDSSALYCTELIWAAFRSGVGRDPVPQKTRLHGRVYISLSDLHDAVIFMPVK